MNLRLALALSLALGCTQRAELFQGVDAEPDGSIDEPVDGSTPRDAGGADDATTPSDAAMDPDAGPQTDSGMPMPTSRLVLSSGLDHVCAIVDGALWCWGLGDQGQLGIGGNVPRTSPTRVDDSDTWVAVCGGDEHTCALRADRSLYCWGRNFHGELGVGDFARHDSPTPVPNTNFVRIACGGGTTCGLSGDGALSCWGDNREGKLGQDDSFATAEDSPRPVRVAPNTSFREVAVGQGHVCAIASNGALWCWGRNTNGQLGIETPQEQQRSPARVTGLDDMREVAAGMAHSCAIEASGKLWCWGTDNTGSLGLGNGVGRETRPRAVSMDSDWRQISVQWFHSCALRGTDAYCWGRGDEGQLGLGDGEDQTQPARVGRTSGWQDMQVGHFHSCGIRDNDVLCWGLNEAGQAGVGDTMKQDVPREVTFR